MGSNDKNEFDELGRQITDIVDKAVNSHDYQKLNESINQAVSRALDRAIDNGSDALKDALRNTLGIGVGTDAYKRYRYTPPESFKKDKKPEEKKVVLYANTNGEQVKGAFMTIVGGVLAVGNGLALIGSGLLNSLTSGGIAGVGSIVLSALFLGGIGLFAAGSRLYGLAGRFKKYVKALGKKTFINVDALPKVSGKPLKVVRKDLKTMIDKGWFIEGHLDEKETILITSNETYQQYEDANAGYRQRQKEEAASASSKKTLTPQVQEILDKGNAFLDKIHKSNDAIPGEEISAKISHMEEIVSKIFERAEEHPEIVSDLKKLMNYYLPMTVKLLDAYEDMDRQPVQGENIQRSKREIEATLDTLNTAFENLFDSVFKETAWDVSSDITVLETLLAQEGLTEDEIHKRRRTETYAGTTTGQSQAVSGSAVQQSQTAAETVPQQGQTMTQSAKAGAGQVQTAGASQVQTAGGYAYAAQAQTQEQAEEEYKIELKL